MCACLCVRVYACDRERVTGIGGRKEGERKSERKINEI